MKMDLLFVLTRELFQNVQGFTGIFHLENVGLHLVIVGRVQDHHEFAVECGEQHAMIGIFVNERFLLLTPLDRRVFRSRKSPD